MERTTMLGHSEPQEHDDDTVPRGAMPEDDDERASRTDSHTPSGQPATANPSQRGAGGVHVSRRGAGDGVSLIQRVKDAMPLLDYVKTLRPNMKLAAGGKGEYYGSCVSPDHDDGDPSFYVSTAKNCYECKGCGITGNVVTLYALIHGMEFDDAKFELARKLGVFNERRLDDAESMLVNTNKRYQWQLERKLDALAYLKQERGLKQETIDRFGIGYCWGTEYKNADQAAWKLAIETGCAYPPQDANDTRPPRSRMQGRITFPIRDKTGKLVGFGGRSVPNGMALTGPKYINTPETAYFHKGELLYGLSEAGAGISKKGYAVAVEGYMDVAILHQEGVDNAIGVMGAAANEIAFKTLWTVTKRLVFCLDPDAAGQRGTMRSVELAAPTMEDGCEILIAHMPGKFDPDEYVLKFGAEAFFALCEAQSVPLSRYMMSAKAHHFDLRMPEGRAKFLVAAKEVGATFRSAPLVGEQVMAEARAICAAALVDTALRETGLADEIGPQEIKEGIRLLERRLANIQSAEVARAALPAPQEAASASVTAPAAVVDSEEQAGVRPSPRPR